MLSLIYVEITGLSSGLSEYTEYMVTAIIRTNEDTMKNIFDYSVIIDIKETSILGMDQILESICFN